MTWFVSIPSVQSEYFIPITWFWSNLNNSTRGFVAASYFTTFLFYLLVSVTEMVAWFVYLEGDGMFAALYMGLVGYWGSIVLYILPWLFALFHFTAPVTNGGIAGAMGNLSTGTDLFMLIGGFCFWIIHMALHIMFVPRFVNHVAAIQHCKNCSLYNQSCLQKCPATGTPSVDYGETDENFIFIY